MKFKLFFFLLLPVFINAQSIPTSIEIISIEGRDLRANGMTVFEDNSYCIFGGIDDSALFSFYTEQGVLEDHHEVSLDVDDQFVHQLIEGESGTLFGIIRNQGPNGLPHFVFAMDGETKEILWMQKFDSGTYPGSRFEVVIEDTDNELLWLMGMIEPGTAPGGGQDYMVLQLNPASGEIINDFFYTVGNTDNFRSVYRKGDFLYCSGTTRIGSSVSDIRPCLGKLDLNGNLIWLKYFLKDENQNARLYAPAMVSEDDGFVFSGYGNLGGSVLSNGSLQIYKTDNDGIYIWGLNLTPLEPGLDLVRSNAIIKVEDGYVVNGLYIDSNSKFRTIIFKTSFDGAFSWSREIGHTGSLESFGLDTYSDRMVLTGKVAGPDNMQFIANLSLNGEVEGTECFWLKRFDMQKEALSSETYNAAYLNYQPNIGFENITDYSVLSIEPAVDTPCKGISSVHEDFSIGQLQIFPTPASSDILISLPENISGSDARLKIYDTNGRLVLTNDNFNLSDSIDISFLNTGMYFIEVFLNKQQKVFVGKVIKEK